MARVATKTMQGIDEQDAYQGFNEQELFAPEQLAPTEKVSYVQNPLRIQGSVEQRNIQRGKSESSVYDTGRSTDSDKAKPRRKSSGETLKHMEIHLDSQMPPTVESFMQIKQRGGLVALGYEIEQEDISKCRKCKSMCACEVMAVCIPVFVCAVTHLAISIVYFGYFDAIGITIFITMAAVSVCLVLSFLFRIFLAVFYVKVPPQPGQSDEPRCKILQLHKVVKYITKIHNSVLDVDGEYYLLKMYAAESLECGLQLYNIVTIYSCSMSIDWSHVFCWFLATESMYNTYKAFHMRDQVSRDQQLVVDVLTDSICLFFPLYYLHFALDIPVEETAMLQLTCLPTLFLMSKANDVWGNLVKIEMKRIDKSNIKVDTVRKLKRRRTRRVSNISGSVSFAASPLCCGGRDMVENDEDGTLQVPSRTSRRRSIMAQSDAVAVIDTQKKHFKRFRHYFIVINILFIASFLSLSLIHFVRFPRAEECNKLLTEKVWSSCYVRTPYCQHWFTPKCDCAVLEVSNYTEASFPSNMMSEMKSLIKIGVYNGRLEQLPHDIGDHVARQLAVLEVVGNKLRTLPQSLEKCSQLLAVRLIQNNLTALPSYFRTFTTLYVLQVDSNFIEAFHGNIIELTALRELYVRNNSLNVLPQQLENLKKLSILDVRQNNLTAFPTMGNDRSLRVYAEGNPLCRSDHGSANIPWTIDAVCKPQCSSSCLDVQTDNLWCDDSDYSRKRYLPNQAKPIMGGGCNTPSCNFDNGMCPN